MIFLNGVYLPFSQAKIESRDRGFLLGDGLFETVPVYQDNVFCLKEHYARHEDEMSKPHENSLLLTNNFTSKGLAADLNQHAARHEVEVKSKL